MSQKMKFRFCYPGRQHITRSDGTLWLLTAPVQGLGCGELRHVCTRLRAIFLRVLGFRTCWRTAFALPGPALATTREFAFVGANALWTP